MNSETQSILDHIDAIDQKILVHLVKNARISFIDIANECGISRAAIHQRVKKLEDSGIIVGSQYIVKPAALGFKVCAFVGVQLEQANMYTEVMAQLQNISEVVECHFVTGEFVVLLKVYCRNNDHLMSILINTIQNIPGVSRTNTFMSLDQAFERQVWVRNTEEVKEVKKEKKKKVN